MKALFLDFDGVVNDWGENGDERLMLRPEKFMMIDDIINECSDDVHLVISSTWRIHQPEESFKFWVRRLGCWSWKDLSLTKWIIQKRGEEITTEARTWTGLHFRGVEIDEWLSRHPEIDGYIIIDDDSDFFDHQLPFHVQVYGRVGFTVENKQQAIGLFKGME